MIKIEGIVEDIIFHNEENGYSVIAVATKDGEKTCVGNMFKIAIGEEIMIEGERTAHPIYGEQITIENYSTMIPKEMKSFERYLGSGAIKGIGPVLAKKIVDRFGEDTYYVMENEPEKLEEVNGISLKKAQLIAATFFEQRSVRQALMFLQEYQISLTYALKIYAYYKERVYKVVKENPYQLAEDIHGIGFKMADGIAKKLGVLEDDPNRVAAAILYVLNMAGQEGHVYLEKEKLLLRTKELLQIEGEQIDHALMTLQLKQGIVIEEIERKNKKIIAVYLYYYYKMEEIIAGNLLQLLQYEIKQIKQVDTDIERIEKKHKITLDSIQKEAIVKGVNTPVFILTGGPGTGKTTTINAIIEVFEQEDMEIALCAPTGRAAKRMTETTGKEAKTIHRLLEINYAGNEGASQSFERNEEYPLEYDVVIVDEASMIDVSLFYALMKAIPLGSRLVLVGDKDQLPSVGAGNVLRDLIDVEHIIPTTILQKIYRQAEKSAIVLNSHKIHNGEMVEYKEKDDFFLIRRENPNDVKKEIISLVKERLPKFTGIPYEEGIQILSPMRKGVLGTNQLNIDLQQALNPPNTTKSEKKYRETIFREGDKVMQIRNNYSLSWRIYNEYNFMQDEGVGVFNGDLGVIKEVNHYLEVIKVLFDDGKQVEYEYSQLDELELAYAVTIHKSQGSEYPIVIIPLFHGPPMLLSRNLLYTAVTRAKQLVVLIGNINVLKNMIANDKEVDRNSTLDHKIRELAEFY